MLLKSLAGFRRAAESSALSCPPRTFSRCGCGDRAHAIPPCKFVVQRSDDGLLFSDPFLMGIYTSELEVEQDWDRSPEPPAACSRRVPLPWCRACFPCWTSITSITHYFGLSLYFWKSSHGSISSPVTGFFTSLQSLCSGLTLRAGAKENKRKKHNKRGAVASEGCRSPSP